MTQGVISRYEIKIAALEDQPAVSVLCPFGIKEQISKNARSGLAKSGLVYFKKMITNFAKNIAEHNSAEACNKTETKEVISKSEASVLEASEGYYCIEESHNDPSLAAFKICKDLEQPTVPLSNDQNKRSSFLDIKHFLKVSQPVCVAERRHGLLKRAQFSSSSSDQKLASQRSKLAVRLEKKLKTLNSSLEFANSVNKETMISIKLDKMYRNNLKKASKSGRYLLTSIPEDVYHP